METFLGLLIIAIGAFCQSSCYVPINKIKDWSWESYWLVQGVFAWVVLPLLGAQLAIPAGQSLVQLFASAPTFNLCATLLFGVLWGIGGLTFGLSMRFLGVALGQSVALGTCAALGTIMGPVLLNTFFPELNALESLTFSVIIGVVATLIGIAIIGIAGGMKAASLSDEEKRAAVRDFNFPKGMAIALLFIGLYASTSVPVLRLLTSDEAVVQAARQFLPWLLLMPPLGCAAFTWDGIFLGATASRGLMVSMAGAAAAFFAVWFAGRALLQPAGATALHLLFAAYFSHLAFRTLWLTLRCRREVLAGSQNFQ